MRLFRKREKREQYWPIHFHSPFTKEPWTILQCTKHPANKHLQFPYTEEAKGWCVDCVKAGERPSWTPASEAERGPYWRSLVERRGRSELANLDDPTLSSMRWTSH